MKTSLEKEQLIQHQSVPTLSTQKFINERRYTLGKKFQFPDDLGKYWFLISVGLIVSSFVSGVDFGEFKIPDKFGEFAGYSRTIGMILFGLYLLFHIAWFKYPQETKLTENAQEADSPIGPLSLNHPVRLDGVQNFIQDTSGMSLFSERFHGLYNFKNMQLTWVGNAPSGARGSLCFSIIENPLLKQNITLLDYANELYTVMAKTGLYRNRNVSTGPSMNIAVQWYIITVPDGIGKFHDVHQLCKIVVMGEWLAYLFASYTDAASPEQKSVLLETFEKFGS